MPSYATDCNEGQKIRKENMPSKQTNNKKNPPKIML